MGANQIYKGLYVAGTSTVLSFVIGLAVIAGIEAYGPSSSEPGRVIERVESEYTQTKCIAGRPGGSRCSTQTLPAYSVTGEREDGTTWIVSGQGPYDAMRGERGEIRVATSTITGRVVALRGSGPRDYWGVRGSSMVVFSLGALIGGVGLFALFEWSRRRAHNWGWGTFSPRILTAALPGVLLGLFGLWYVTWQPTQGLETLSSQDRYGQFLEEPLATITAPVPEDFADDAVVPGVPFGDTGASMIVASYSQLTKDYRTRVAETDYPAVPVALHHKSGPTTKVVVRDTDDAGALYDPVDCITGQPNTRASVVGVAFDLEDIGIDRDVGATIVCLPKQATGPIEILFGASLPKLYSLSLDQLTG